MPLHVRKGLLGLCLAFILSAVVVPSITLGASNWWALPYNISVVWPHDAQGHPTGVAQSQFVNVSIWPNSQVSCATDVTAAAVAGVGLFAAKNNEPVEILTPTTPGALILRHVGGVTFPSFEFNDVAADLTTDPTSQYRFTTWAGNVWVHAADARTLLPNQAMPTGTFPAQPGDLLDLRIQVVWPHDRQGNFAPVDRAPLVNVAVDLFAHGTLKSVPPDFQPYVDFAPSLSAAVQNGTIETVGVQPKKTTYVMNGVTYPRWVFNDVPVQRASNTIFWLRSRQT
jgi:hypothetical protein